MKEQKIFCVKTYYETKFFHIVQARYRTKFNFNIFPNNQEHLGFKNQTARVWPDLCNGGAKYMESLYLLFGTFWLRISHFIPTESKASINWLRPIWKRVAMCQWLSQKIDDDEEFLNDVCFTDETHVLLNGHVKSKNWVFRGKWERSQGP